MAKTKEAKAAGHASWAVRRPDEPGKADDLTEAELQRFRKARSRKVQTILNAMIRTGNADKGLLAHRIEVYARNFPGVDPVVIADDTAEGLIDACVALRLELRKRFPTA